MKNLEGKVVLVTGATRGIGHAIAESFINSGATVIGTATTEIGAINISNHFSNKGKGFILDVTDMNSIKKLIHSINSEFGLVDILVNNAGITRDNLLIRMKSHEWAHVIETNLTSVFNLSKAVLPNMIKKRNGRIINVGSIVGTIGNVGQSNYSAAKSGIIGFTKSLAKEVASRGITVNAVAPGFIDTDMTKSMNSAHRDKILSSIPVRRFGKPIEIASVVVFLASSESSYITGETLNVNGGMCMV
ncbi:3-oxoacyl reductase [Candidatus Photodesmus katoptron]|uniref:3-oxoacyl-[acyl-carrier-protein] reductase n=1 Tax=Candidatus Photodesmus katoptron Akat1 TaxID=1236703 RepID=S3DIV4_9GAMM|nr:3-oxoacyl-ACP reductase FabG [Candidatus Photodesmus katoptron]EPE37645.1 3-oxoacyl reductase [Candidatus Photodesmus katoptron Akat1]KEY90635.1 3-oxoacyl reductase [Candidatus Photodesmus katoptron]